MVEFDLSHNKNLISSFLFSKRPLSYLVEWYRDNKLLIDITLQKSLVDLECVTDVLGGVLVQAVDLVQGHLLGQVAVSGDETSH